MAKEPEEDEGFEGGEGEPEFEGGGGGRKKWMLIAGVALLLVIGGGAVAYLTHLTDPLVAMITGKPASDDASHEPEKHAAAPAAGDHGAASAAIQPIALPDMLVNINSGRKKEYLKVSIVVELASEADVTRFQEVTPRITDSFLIYLGELRREDLDGSAGKFRIKEELLARVNAAMRPAQARDVLFKEFMIQ